MTDEIKKMLEPARFEMMLYTPNAPKKVYVDGEDFDRLKRGFECVVEQRDYYRWTVGDDVEAHNKKIMKDDAELLKAMRGDG